MPAPVRNDLGNKITFIAQDAIKEGQPVEISDGQAMEVKLFKTAGGRPDGVATNTVAAGGEVSVAFAPALVPVLIGSGNDDLATIQGGLLKVTAEGNWSLAASGDGSGTIYPAKAVAETGKGGLGSGMLFGYGSIKG